MNIGETDVGLWIGRNLPVTDVGFSNSASISEQHSLVPAGRCCIGRKFQWNRDAAVEMLAVW